MTTLHWSVTVELDGEQVVTISHNHLAGHPEPNEEAIRTAAHHLLAFIGDPNSASVFFPPKGDVTPLGQEYLERRIPCLQEVIDRQEWRLRDAEASKREYWVGRLHEAKIALTNLTCSLERCADGFPKPSAHLNGEGRDLSSESR